MTIYYMKEIKSKSGQTIGFSKIEKDTKKTKAPKGTIKVDMNSINFDEYQRNPKRFYLSGMTLMRLEQN